MRINYDNIIFKLQENSEGGISLYWREMISRLREKADDLRFFSGRGENIFEPKNISAKKESVVSSKILRYLPFQRILPTGSIFHSSYYRISLQPSIKNVVTVHDFVYERFRKGPAKWVHQLQKSFAIKNADAIICISENTKKDLLGYYPKLDLGKISVIYHGVSESYFPTGKMLEKKFGDLGKYVLFVGGRSVYKNFDIAVEAIVELEEYNFVFAGGGELSRKEEKLLDSKLRGRYFHFPSVGEEDLNALYNNAFCFLYPSAYEGFGMSVLEAMRAGCPVVSSKSSSIPEVAGDAGILVSEISAESFTEAIRKLEVADLREKLIQRGLEQSKKFSWNKCFRETYSIYEKLGS